MGKPEDIPKDVWDRAIAIETGYEGGEDGRRPVFIARAILSAVEEEREACAGLVEGFSPIRAAFTTEDESGMKWEHPAVQMPIYSPAELIAAIRNRKGA